VEYCWVTTLSFLTSLSAAGLWYVCFKVQHMLIQLSGFTYIVLFLKSNYQPNTKTANSESIASTFLTVSTHAAVTSLIIIRLFRTRRTLAKLLPLSEVQVYTGVIAILIESAAPLAVFGVISAILQQLNASGSFLRRSEAFYVCVFVFRALFISFCVSLAIEAVRNSIWLTSLMTGTIAAHAHFSGHDWSLIHQLPCTQRQSHIQSHSIRSPKF
jgi:hypothetical protein